MVEKLSWPTFSTTQAVWEAQIVEKVGFDNFFHVFHQFLRKFFSRKWWKKLSRPTFSSIFVRKKTSSEIRGKSGKSCQNQLFPRLKPFWRPKSWKKLVLTTFSTICMVPKTSKKFVEKVEKVVLAKIFHDSGRFGGLNRGQSWPGQLFHHFYDSKDFLKNSWKNWKKLSWPRFSTFWRPESWTKLARTIFSTISMIPKTSSKIRGKSGKSWPGQHFPRQFPLLLVVGSLQTF